MSKVRVQNAAAKAPWLRNVSHYVNLRALQAEPFYADLHTAYPTGEYTSKRSDDGFAESP